MARHEEIAEFIHQQLSEEDQGLATGRRSTRRTKGSTRRHYFSDLNRQVLFDRQDEARIVAKQLVDGLLL
jgi:hypothetical protein